MINNKEMFCTVFGALTMIDNISDSNKSKLIQKSGEKFGLDIDQMKNIISDLDKTIAFILANLLQDNNKIDYK